MTIPDKIASIGREGFIRADGLEVSIIIVDARVRPDAVDYLVEPTAGSGRRWVDADRVRLMPRERS